MCATCFLMRVVPCLQYGTPRVTAAHEKTGRKFAAFSGYSQGQERQIIATGRVYLRALALRQGKYMSLALRAVGDPSLLAPVAPAPVAAEPPAQTPQQTSAQTPAQTPAQTHSPSAEIDEASDSEQDMAWESGAGWEIPLNEIPL